MADALITYGWNRIAYNALRSLTAAGVSVVVGDTGAAQPLASNSR